MSEQHIISEYLRKNTAEVFRDLKTVCEIPSPTFHEQRRILHLSRMMSSLDLSDVRPDSEGNAIGFLISNPKQDSYVLLSAHTDTVCKLDSIHVEDDGKYLCAHGICDNSAGVTALMTFIKLLQETKISLAKNYLVAFTVCEEGLGAKRGMKKIMSKYDGKISYVVNIESHDIGRITNACMGQYRIRLSVQTKQRGAHSFHDFGEPNAVVILSSIIHELSRVNLPEKTTFNVTELQG